MQPFLVSFKKGVYEAPLPKCKCVYVYVNFPKGMPTTSSLPHSITDGDGEEKKKKEYSVPLLTLPSPQKLSRMMPYSYHRYQEKKTREGEKLWWGNYFMGPSGRQAEEASSQGSSWQLNKLGFSVSSSPEKAQNVSCSQKKIQAFESTTSRGLRLALWRA